jgi:hypothetical protein
MEKILKTAALVMILSFGFVTQADTTWLGAVYIQNYERGNTTQRGFDNQPIYFNIASYAQYTVLFEYYKQGVTESLDNSSWQKINAQVSLIDDKDGSVVKSGYASIVGTDGNNYVYKIELNKYLPDTVATLPPELQNSGVMKTHLVVKMDGSQRLSIPVQLTYQP